MVLFGLNKKAPKQSDTSITAPVAVTSSSPSSASNTSGPSASALTEALRGNPFRTASSSKSADARVTNEADRKHRELEEINKALNTLAHLFPDIKIEVFRELLARFDGRSRLEVCVEQLLKNRVEWVKGRWNDPSDSSATTSITDMATSTARENTGTRGGSTNQGRGERGFVNRVPKEERFKSEAYKSAVKSVLVTEFRGLSKSAVDAVLAEANFSYSRARPILRDLSQKSWRVAWANMLSFKKKNASQNPDPPFLVWQTYNDGGDAVPILRGTGCAELDNELYSTFIHPLLNQRREQQILEDAKSAQEMNDNEAEAANALFECSCCLSDVTFEQVSSCSEDGHLICFGCIQRTLHEAIFGQGWDKSIDANRSTLRCIAPVAQGTCEGILDVDLVKRAVQSEKSGSQTYQKFEDRIASDALMRSNLTLIHCPFCSYAEIDSVFHPTNGLKWRFRKSAFIPSLALLMILLDIILLLLIPLLLLLLICPSTLSDIFAKSLQNICLKTRSQRFRCASPQCGRESCLTCHKTWVDPHLCQESLLHSLRTAVESARTAAVKRTCPRCGLSFVKESGCNKLTCLCGYSMCYLCRKGLGTSKAPNNEAGGAMPRLLDGAVDPGQGQEEAGEQQQGEGYEHFCAHFRLTPGMPCSKCTKCELYRSENEDAVAQRAGEKAMQEWQIRNGVPEKDQMDIASDLQGAESSPQRGRIVDIYQQSNNNIGQTLYWSFLSADFWRDEGWKIEIQRIVDKFMENFVAVDAT
ncbi:hypothetical protein FQN57_006526 [Myotisia sp. PD_48]|nr:hypothetical protein FQN57_006526 [Myotisia sp. PD_48]